MMDTYKAGDKAVIDDCTKDARTWSIGGNDTLILDVGQVVEIVENSTGSLLPVSVWIKNPRTDIFKLDILQISKFNLKPYVSFDLNSCTCTIMILMSQGCRCGGH